MHDVFHRVMGFINVVKRAVLQTVVIGIVFFLANVVVGLIQQFQSSMEAAAAV
jgi:hypothetical protein